MPEITAMNFHRSLIWTVDVAWHKCYGVVGGDTRFLLWDHIAAQLLKSYGSLPARKTTFVFPDYGRITVLT